jgi:hypothetical protein
VPTPPPGLTYREDDHGAMKQPFQSPKLRRLQHQLKAA